MIIYIQNIQNKIIHQKGNIMLINDLSYCEDIKSVEEKIVGGINQGGYDLVVSYPSNNHLTSVITSYTSDDKRTKENPVPCDQYIGIPSPWEAHIFEPKTTLRLEGEPLSWEC
ncbi:hypothetical protein [Moorena sp. SIO3H5]|uniref:hypothetical protein n=1 Tax=Moorena sp. SIO3H5 TaxID=2607834 RepID=UPI0013BD2B7F|nr:hypothetical protein [Moorena sp. SIO3H5]NEO72723.1 hypothetical protein [Moorena sp. SIO3H5]